MCAMQRNNVPNQQANEMPQPPLRPQYRFRTAWWLGVPVIVIVFLWFIGGLDVAFSFLDIASVFGVALTDRYVLLACLGIVLITITLIAKALTKKND